MHTGCANQPKAELDYEQTKQMMIDVLQTDEGKKVLSDIISDDKLKQQLIIESDIVKETLSDTLTSKEGKDMWKSLFSDPKFIESFHSSIADEQKKLFKQLMNDAEFQKKMLDLLQDPEMNKQTIKLLKSQQFRKHLENTIIETIDNPLFKSKLEKSMNDKSSEKDKKGQDDESEKDNEEGKQ